MVTTTRGKEIRTEIAPNKIFFFSSRRQHTTWPRDWSSDVCSSDLHFTLLVPPRILSGQNRNISRLVLLAFFFVLFALVVFAHEFAVCVKLEAPLFTILFDDGFIVAALFFPAKDFTALGLCVGSLLRRGGHIRAADALLFFFFFRLCDNAEGESGTDRCDCEQLWCIHGYLTSTDRSQELFEYRKH